MKNKILELIDEQQSPLFRIMSIHNENEPVRRHFDNNICAFHIGNGYVLSVAHNLRIEAQLFKSIREKTFQKNIINNCNPNETNLFTKCFILDTQTNMRYLNITDQEDVPLLIDILKQMNYDTRWVTLYSKGICKPFLIIQFKNDLFYNDTAATGLFNPNYTFLEPSINIHTFLIELKLVKPYYKEDFALYKIVGADQSIVDKIPTAHISYELLETGKLLYCLQGSPGGTNYGRMVNEARIEGILDHHAVGPDRIGGNINREGLRYLLKGYFRFGSSGAPYFVYDNESNCFNINAIQSEAVPIQLTINNKREGNCQYVNAIASPLRIIKNDLNDEMNI